MEPRIRLDIDKKQGALVKAAQGLLDEFDMMEVFHGKEHPLRNVLNVSLSAQCVEVVTNFVRYQCGRVEHENASWRKLDKKTNKRMFADALVHALEADNGAVKTHTKDIVGQAGGTDLEREVAAQLARQFMGYLVRYHRYLVPAKRSPRTGRTSAERS